MNEDLSEIRQLARQWLDDGEDDTLFRMWRAITACFPRGLPPDPREPTFIRCDGVDGRDSVARVDADNRVVEFGVEPFVRPTWPRRWQSISLLDATSIFAKRAERVDAIWSGYGAQVLRQKKGEWSWLVVVDRTRTVRCGHSFETRCQAIYDLSAWLLRNALPPTPRVFTAG
jgi:hypothetical protein